MIAKPVVVGLGRLTHLALRSDTRAEGRTYCGRWWTADAIDPDIDIDCYQCRAAYAAGRHPKEVNRMEERARTAEGRREQRRRETEAEDQALLLALNAMGSRGLGRHLKFDGNDRDAVMAALHGAGFDVAREKYIEKPF